MSRTEAQLARRRGVGEALLELAARDGLAGVSVRKVAARAGCSVGAVQKHFPTSDDMLAFALDLAGERTLDRLAAVPTDGAVAQVVLRWVLATLPLDDERRAEARIWIEFAARAASHLPFAVTLAETDGWVQESLAGFLEQARDRGELPAGLRCSEVACALLAVADGLAVRLLHSSDADAVSHVRSALEVAVRALLSGPGAGTATRDAARR